MAHTFSVPKWETNLAASSASIDLFRKAQTRNETQNKQKMGKNVKAPNHKLKKLKSNKEPVPKRNSKLKKQLKHTIQQNSNKNVGKDNEQTKSNVERKKEMKRKILNKNISLKNTGAVQKQNLKNKNHRNLQQKVKPVLQNNPQYKSRKEQSTLSLRERMVDKLKGARFRFLNEQLYKNKGIDAMRYFKQNPSDYSAYHEGYRHQVLKWPLNPVDVIIKDIMKLPNSKIIADFGCGEAKLAKTVQHKVHSFDLVASDECITACDMAHVPLENNSVDVVVFCLSLMGINLKDYLLEASRVLRNGGILKMAEVESRIEDVNAFVRNIENFGFTKTRKNLSHNLFCFMDFVKKDHVKQKNKLPEIHLSPCLYKKR